MLGIYTSGVCAFPTQILTFDWTQTDQRRACQPCRHFRELVSQPHRFFAKIMNMLISPKRIQKTSLEEIPCICYWSNPRCHVCFLGRLRYVRCQTFSSLSSPLVLIYFPRELQISNRCLRRWLKHPNSSWLQQPFHGRDLRRLSRWIHDEDRPILLGIPCLGDSYVRHLLFRG